MNEKGELNDDPAKHSPGSIFRTWQSSLSRRSTTRYCTARSGRCRGSAVPGLPAGDVRLFMMPGMLHCAGGPGPSVVDWLTVVERWHDTGVAPEEVVAGWPDRDGGRPLCAWLKVARLDGGDAGPPTSWSCR
jgi:hypothetical protein